MRIARSKGIARIAGARHINVPETRVATDGIRDEDVDGRIGNIAGQRRRCSRAASHPAGVVNVIGTAIKR